MIREWYIKKGTALHLNHFLLRAKDSGDWIGDTITESGFRALLTNKIDSVNMQYVKDDIKRFVKDAKRIDIWSPKYFHDLVSHLKLTGE